MPFFPPKRQLDQQALVDFQSGSRKIQPQDVLSFSLLGTIFLSHLFVSDKPMEGLSVHGNRWAGLWGSGPRPQGHRPVPP